MPQQPKHPIRNSILAIAIFAAFVPHAAYAGYTVMDDDMFPEKAIPASIAARYERPASSPQPRAATANVQAQAAERAPAQDGNSFAVMFKKGGSGLTDNAIDRVSTLLPLMQTRQVIIIGRPDDRANQQLAQSRANAVRIWLLRQGVPPSQIKNQIDNSPTAPVDGESPIELRIIDPNATPVAASTPSPYSVLAGAASPAQLAALAAAPKPPTATTAIATTQAKPAAPATPAKTDVRMDMIQQVIAAVEQGQLDPKTAVSTIRALLAAAPTTQPMVAPAPVAAPILHAAPAAPTVTVAAIATPAPPPPKPALVLIAAPQTAKPKEWKLLASKTVRDNIVDWAATEGYKVEWQPANYYQVSGGDADLPPGTLLDTIDYVAGAAGLKMEVWKKGEKKIRISDNPNAPRS